MTLWWFWVYALMLWNVIHYLCFIMYFMVLCWMWLCLLPWALEKWDINLINKLQSHTKTTVLKAFLNQSKPCVCLLNLTQFKMYSIHSAYWVLSNDGLKSYKLYSSSILTARAKLLKEERRLALCSLVLRPLVAALPFTSLQNVHFNQQVVLCIPSSKTSCRKSSSRKASNSTDGRCAEHHWKTAGFQSVLQKKRYVWFMYHRLFCRLSMF